MPEQEGHKMDMFNNSKIFETEIGMYTKALPKFEEILKKAGDDVQLCTPCVYHSLEPRKVIIFEDLCTQGYIVVRDRPNTMEELKAAYSKLAKMQAVSYLILNENPDYLKEFKNGILAMPHMLKDPFVTKAISNFAEFLETQPNLAKYASYFKSIESTFLQSFVDVTEEYRSNPQNDGYYVLSHGDFHLRNMMFKHDKANGSLKDCLLIDFQMSNICPMSADLIYSIFMLMTPEERRNHDKELLKYYLSIFVETLQKLGFKGQLPNVVDFWRQIHRHKIYAFFYLTLLPMSFAMIDPSIDLSQLMSNNDLRKKIFFNKEYIEEVNYLLPRYDKLGYFN